MIRRLNMFFVVAVLLCLLPVTASAAETVASGSCGASVNWILTDDGTLTISGVGDMSNYALGYAPWYSYKDQITTVVVSDGVTSVGNYSFYNMDNVSYVKMSDSVISIGNSSFSYSEGFSYIRIPDSLRSLGSHAFSGTSLISVTLPATVQSIGSFAFSNCKKLVSLVCLSSSPPTMGTEVFANYEVFSRIMVPDGSADSYKAASGWSDYAGFIVDDGVGVQTFTVSTSFNGQTIYIDSDETVDFFIMASGVSGTVTARWYMGVTLLEEGDFVYINSSQAIQGWRYTPGGDGTRVFYAVVTHTLDGVSESVTTDFVKIVVGSGDGSGSGTEINDRLDQIDVGLTEVKDAIAEVNGKVDGLSDQLDDLQSGGSAGEDLTDQSGQLSDDLAGIDEFEQSQMDILDSGMVQIKESVSYTSFIPALAFVQRYADMIFDSVFDISIIFYLPMFLGLFFFLCSRVPYNIKDVGPKEKKNSIGFKY